MKGLRRIAAAAIAVTLVLAASARAGTAEEIEHLLESVRDSECTFVRNGVDADGAAAAAHLRTKYAYVKRWVGSAEDFIRLAASASSITGEPYRVRCGGSEGPSADWLETELRRYRERARR